MFTRYYNDVSNDDTQPLFAPTGQGASAGVGTTDVVPGDATSTATATLGGVIDGTIDTDGDHDWYKVTLFAGQTYTFSTILSGGLSDSVLALRDGTGALIQQNDDAVQDGSQTFSEITYTAPTTGTYFLDVSGFGSDVGTFQLTATKPATDSIAASSATTASLAIGATVSGTIDSKGDHDWYAVQLVAGQAYVFETLPTATNPDLDTTLMLRNASGAGLAFNDDAGGGSTSRIRFTPTQSGTYYVDVGHFGNYATAPYQVSAAIAPPLQVFTNDQIATQLTSTYWGGFTRHFAVVPGGTLTVNVSALTADGQFLARQALNLWSDATGIVFSEVTSGGSIVFDDAQPGAYSTSITNGGLIESSQVNVATSWISGSGANLRSYGFQTYIHEIGHALGLGHAGDYNTNASYAQDASYLNDSWATTVMSYFDQAENTYFANLGFAQVYIVSPMAADIVAATNLYGTPTGTRTGDTVYGFGNTSGRAIYDAASGQTAVGATIVDHGGVDTLNYSGYISNALLNLNPETFSNVGGSVGSLVIARGTIIENAIGGAGDDRIIGNAVANALTGGLGADTLSGGGDRDVFRGTVAEMNGDRILDFTVLDTIQVSDASAATFGFTRSGTTLSFGGSSLTIDGLAALGLAFRAAAGGGVELYSTGAKTLFDNSGDGRADLFWTNNAGAVGEWDSQGSSFLIGPGATAGAGWSVTGRADVNGDGRSDVVWRHTSGTVATWYAVSGGFQAGMGSSAPSDWVIVGTGDFNGDGLGDLLWRNSVGTVATWHSTGTAFASGPGSSASTEWSIVGTGDFNGDGKSDIVWRHSSGGYAEWLSTGTGFLPGPGGQRDASWTIAGTGDFNGDGKADLMWRNTSGAYEEWYSTPTGFSVGLSGSVDSAWQIHDIADYTGDGRADLVWRNTGGAVSAWFTSDAGFIQGFNGFAPVEWQIV